MGVTIHYKLGQSEEFVSKMLDWAQIVAETYRKEAEIKKIPFEIRRISDKRLDIDIGNCETLVFSFNRLSDYEKESKNGYNYEYETLIRGEGIGKQDEDLLWASAFCKTQFSNKVVEHEMVAEIIRTVASRCRIASVYDEGDYYHSCNLEDAKKNIIENGKLIGKVGEMLKQKGWNDDQIVKGETKIK